ncbi:MAG: VWA domain-containing protein, partial [Vicinamibacterales bacterium]
NCRAGPDMKVALSLAFVSVLGAVATPQQVFRAGVDGVAIQAAVARGDRPVAGLGARDFALHDNGVAQEITAVAAETLPVDVTLLLDASASVDGATLARLKAAVNDTASLLHAEDRLRLIAISQVLRQVFDFRPRGEAMPLDALGAEGATSLYDALGAAMMRPSDPGRRQLVVAFTDGADSTSILDESAVRQIARRTDAVVDVVVPMTTEEAPPNQPATNTFRQPLAAALTSGTNVVAGSPSEMADRARDLQPWAKKAAVTTTLSDLVSPTTGQVFAIGARDSIAGAFRQTLDDFRQSYVIEYVPRGVSPGGWHDVMVTVLKAGKFTVRARRGYEGRDNENPEGSR